MATHEDEPNDLRKVEYGAARPPIIRNTGSTQSERYLAQLAERSFLNLWSYPGLFIDKKNGGNGDGKELCDLLVVCGDHVLIFSDKTIAWPTSPDNQLSWKRWYKRAIWKSAQQIRGAERWINAFPDRIYLDRLCTTPLPIKLPPPERRKIHGIVVALGAGDACKKNFGDGTGSLMIAPAIAGDAHWNAERVVPFAVGDIDPSGSFIHVLDDGSLDIVLRELDTISDFTSYLMKKEAFIRSQKLIVAAGEEDLLAHYLTHINSKNEHDFTHPDGSSFGPDDRVAFDTGLYAGLTQNPQYIAKKKLDLNSYIWDRLIEVFTTHLLAGTSVVPDGHVFDLEDSEQGVRHMALVPRYKRRAFAEGIRDAMVQGGKNHRFTRAFLPGPRELDQHTGYFFMTLAPPNSALEGGYEQYRSIRRNMLEAYALTFLRRYTKLKRMVGIATEPPIRPQIKGSSEDLMMVEVSEWTTELLADLEERAKVFKIAQPGNYSEYEVEETEFPDVPKRGRIPHSLNREQRRAKRADERRRKGQKL